MGFYLQVMTLVFSVMESEGYYKGERIMLIISHLKTIQTGVTAHVVKCLT